MDEVLPHLLDTIQKTNNVVLSAPTGAGKTTRVPIAMLESPWMAGKKIIMLEPRRLAARRAAEYMAAQLGEPVGRTVGYRIRGEAVVGKNTRIEVVTEGILTRLLQSDPDLPDVALIIFDEFHERSIHADLGLALTLDVQEHLRNDLRILVMSATLDGVAVAKLLGDAQLVESAGFLYPITTQYARFASDKPMENRMADAILRALAEQNDDVLAFLPGRREIRRVENILWEKHLPDDVVVHSLYGDAPYQQQSAALSPAPAGKRKVILSTSVAETSLTIDGVCAVIDSGLARTARFDVRRGMSGLVTVPVSKATADQRRGRAGRQMPGTCYRLWTETEHAQLPDYPQPEIKTTDLAPLELHLAQWGSITGNNLRFLDPPPEAHMTQARTLLEELGAIDRNGKLTPHGRAMAELPLHPRFAGMILRSREFHAAVLACDIAALLEERDILAGKKDTDIDLALRLHALHQRHKGDEGVYERMTSQSGRLQQMVGVSRESKKNDEDAAGILLALAYPERVGRRRPAPQNLQTSHRDNNGTRYQMANGITGVLPKGSLLAREEFLAIGEVDGIGAEVRIFLAAPLALTDVQRVFAGALKEEEEIRWNMNEEAVIARSITRLGSMIVSEQNIKLHGEQVQAAMVDGIRQMGLECLPWDKESRTCQQRILWLKKNSLLSEDVPDFSDQALLDSLEQWLLPFLEGIWKKTQLSKLPLLTILKSRPTHSQIRQIDSLAPAQLHLPSGSSVAIDYSGDLPVLAVRLQELFGQTDTPKIGGGTIKILIHLLSPARRPLAVTQDLTSFWTNTYPDIRRQLLARYPKHFWPEDPLSAKPTNRTVKRKP
ncbi:MAG: ATP-dependent helicase HrpB [Ignavibacteriae bacterium]|nr:MAG: ATP-dependent helicase HrpB [Ignavibacteriota bacterium]